MQTLKKGTFSTYIALHNKLLLFRNCFKEIRACHATKLALFSFRTALREQVWPLLALMPYSLLYVLKIQLKRARTTTAYPALKTTDLS